LALGRETRSAFLGRALDGSRSAEFLNSAAKPGDRVIGVDVEDTRFYLIPPLDTLADATLTSPLVAAKSMTGEPLFHALQGAGFAYIFVRRSALKDPPSWYPYVQPEFLNAFTSVAFSDEKAVVYRLRDLR